MIWTDRKTFKNSERRLRETYALTIEWHLTNKFYTDWAIHPNFNIVLNGIAITDANPFRHDQNLQDREPTDTS